MYRIVDLFIYVIYIYVSRYVQDSGLRVEGLGFRVSREGNMLVLFMIR